jgi:myo-inositol-1-phosphate synthase
VAIIGGETAPPHWFKGFISIVMLHDDEFIPGLMHPRLGPYHVRDIEFTAAFEYNATKVGKDLSEAIFAAPIIRITLRMYPTWGAGVSWHDP